MKQVLTKTQKANIKKYIHKEYGDYGSNVEKIKIKEYYSNINKLSKLYKEEEKIQKKLKDNKIRLEKISKRINEQDKKQRSVLK